MVPIEVGIMNQHDRDNLDFLLNASPEVIKDWYEQMDDDDIQYAFELLEAYARELAAEELAANFADRNILIMPLTKTVH